MAQIIYTANPEAGAPGGSLFSGKKLFLTQKTPSRSHFIELIKANGGEVVKLEKNADIIIADDARKEVVSGSYSYKWIDQSIKNGALEDLDDYLAGPQMGAPRAIGSMSRPMKNIRTPYTAEDDRVLFDWVQAQAQRGGSTSGNETFKQLEQQNPRHTWQSWRDRWVKILRFRMPLPPTPQEAPPTLRDVNYTKSPATPRLKTEKPMTPKPQQEKPSGPFIEGGASTPSPMVSNSRTQKTATPQSDTNQLTGTFTDEDIRTLRVLTQDILSIHPERVEEAWKEWAQHHPELSADRWRTFWQTNIVPFARHMNRETIVEAEDEATIEEDGEAIAEEVESPDRDSTPNTSPSFHTQSSHVAQSAPITVRQIKVEVASTLSSPLKRKRPMKGSGISHIPSSPPIISDRPISGAYFPNKRRVLHLQEVPSTPEYEVSTANLPSPPQIEPYVKDTLDQEDDYQYVQADDLPESGRDTTSTLFEPRLQQKDPTNMYVAGSTMGEGDVEYAEDGLPNVYPEVRTSRSHSMDPQQVLSLDRDNGGDKYHGEDSTHVQYPVLPLLENQPPEDTQAILSGEIPDIDFGVPEPDEGWHAFQSSPPPIPSSSRRSNKGKEKAVEYNKHSDTDPADANDQGFEVLNTWIKKQLGKGYPMNQVRLAMTATTMDFQLASKVLRFLGETGDLPTDASGVWTPADDAELAAQDARKIRALQIKHGNDGLDKRHEFLSTCRAVQNEREVRKRSFER